MGLPLLRENQEDTNVSEGKRSVDVEVGGRNITLETGELAKQANGAVLVTSGDTVVLVTATAGIRDFIFPGKQWKFANLSEIVGKSA